MRTIFLIEVIFSPFNYHPAVTLSYRTQSSDKRLFLEPSISGREEISDSSEERFDSISESSMALCDQNSTSEVQTLKKLDRKFIMIKFNSILKTF